MSSYHFRIKRGLKAGLLAAGVAFAPLVAVMPVASVAEVAAKTADTEADFVWLYPGVFSEHEKAMAEAYLADNAALKARGPIDVDALINGRLPANTPGLGPVIKVTEEWVRYNNAKYDPENPLRNDAAYARAQGYQDILAYPVFGANDDLYMIPYPGAARNKLLVSELNHNLTTYKPIYPGDTLYVVADSREVTDLTPPQGSTYRSLAIESKGSIYNQRGEKVNDVTFRVVENIRVYKDQSKAPAEPGFFDIWVAPDWMARPEHYYTDSDWAFIKTVWAKEYRRGNTPFYWDDVKVGDQPAWTLEGPVESSVQPIKPWGMGAGGSRTLKAEITDPKLFKTLVRNQTDGIYRLKTPGAAIPDVPKGETSDQMAASAGDIDTTDIHKDAVKRSPLVNYLGREYAIRHLTNWMGDKGELSNIRWTIMGPRAMADHGFVTPAHPNGEYFLDQVPHMKGRYASAHGLTKDVAIVKSYVTKKYVTDGKFYVDLVWWIETIDGQIFEEGAATVRLPHKAS
ncbi:MAG: hypothetical protein QM645_01890 [Asticcacaulis sp.]